MPSAAFVSSDFTATDPPEPNGCAWYRLVLPSRELAKRGWDTGVGLPRANAEAGIGLAYKDGMLTGWDIYVLKLLMIEQISPLIRSMQARGTRIVVDVDDFHYGLHEDNIASRSTDPHRNPTSNRAFYEQSIREADTVIVSTSFLADFYATRVRDVRLVRNTIDIDRWQPIEHTEEPVLGWVGGTMWRSGDVEILRDWLPAFVKEQGIRVHHSGHIPGDGHHFGARVGLGGVTTTPMCLVSDYPKRMFSMNIGLVPLNRVPFSEAKSNLKGLEYAAKGIPFVATPTEEYRILYESGIGRLAETPDEWRDHVLELLDPDVRREEGERIREIVARDWTIEGRADEWDTAIRG